MPSFRVLFLLRLALGSVSYAAGTPGGLFAPMLVLGSQLVLAVGLLGEAAFPSLGLQPIGFVVVGMAAFFTGVVRVPLTGIVLVIEMTGNFTMLLPMLVACFAAMFVPIILGDPPILRLAAPAHPARCGATTPLTGLYCGKCGRHSISELDLYHPCPGSWSGASQSIATAFAPALSASVLGAYRCSHSASDSGSVKLPQQFWPLDDPLPQPTQQLHGFLCSLFVARPAGIVDDGLEHGEDPVQVGHGTELRMCHPFTRLKPIMRDIAAAV